MKKGVFKMTADAKVGLLLGLFFIVIIAFLVNGLPNFIRQENPTLPDAAIKTPTADDMVLDRLPEVVHRLNPVNTRPENPQPAEPIVLDTTQDTPQVQIPALPQTDQDTQQLDVAQGPVVIQSSDLNQSPAPVQTTRATRTAATHTPTKSHEVKSGESLPVIAKQYYGDEQGNRRIVIQKLYEANNSILKSPDRVCVGDKLVIPPLDQLLNSSVAPVKTVKATPISDTTTNPAKKMLESFPDVFKKLTEKDTKTLPEYVIKEGESLWSIAQQQLGDGNRYKEIAKLNKIKNPNTVPSGVRIKIPAQ
jgi:nucleoid-associated protein YgaU